MFPLQHLLLFCEMTSFICNINMLNGCKNREKVVFRTVASTNCKNKPVQLELESQVTGFLLLLFSKAFLTIPLSQQVCAAGYQVRFSRYIVSLLPLFSDSFGPRLRASVWVLTLLSVVQLFHWFLWLLQVNIACQNQVRNANRQSVWWSGNLV